MAQLSANAKHAHAELKKCSINNDKQDILITCLIMDNAQRSGGVRNMNGGQFLSGAKNTHQDEYGQVQHIIKVVYHKTVSKYGSATQAVNEVLYRCLMLFYKHVQPKLRNFKKEAHNAKCHPFFVQYNLRPFASSNFSVRIGRAFKGNVLFRVL